MLLPPPLYLPLLLNNPLSPFNAALMPMKIKHCPMEHEQPITGHTAEKTAPSSFRIYQLSIALAARCELMIAFLRWGSFYSTRAGLELLLLPSQPPHPVLVLSEKADLWSAKPRSGLYSMACRAARRKDKVSRLSWMLLGSMVILSYHLVTGHRMSQRRGRDCLFSVQLSVLHLWVFRTGWEATLWLQGTSPFGARSWLGGASHWEARPWLAAYRAREA